MASETSSASCSTPIPRECPVPGEPLPQSSQARGPLCDVPWWHRVTQLLERLNRVVEEGNLFDPERPSLGSGLEALHQHLDALSSGPSPRDSHPDRPTGAFWVGGAVPGWQRVGGQGLSCTGISWVCTLTW